MYFKSKRNPIRFALPRGIMAGIIVVLFQLPTSPPSERIYYIQNAEEASSNLWMLNPDNPNQPQQLTFNQSNERILEYQSTSDGRLIVYKTWVTTGSSASGKDKLILLYPDTGTESVLVSCSEPSEAFCDIFALSATGEFLVYYYRLYPDFHELRLIDLRTKPYIENTIYQFNRDDYWHYPRLTSIGHSNIFTFELSGEPYEFQLFNAEQSQMLDILPLGTPNRRPIFSDDGSRYAYYQSEVDMEPRIIEVREAHSPDTILSRYREWDYNLTATGWIGGTINDWHPDSERLLMSIGNWEKCGNSVRIFYQLHIFNTTTGETEPLPGIDDSVIWARWNPDGTQIVYNTAIGDCGEENPQYESVIYDLASSTSTRIPVDGLNPQWVGG